MNGYDLDQLLSDNLNYKKELGRLRAEVQKLRDAPVKVKIIEKPVEIIKTVFKIKEKPVEIVKVKTIEKPVEVIKTVYKTKIVTNEQHVKQIKQLSSQVATLQKEINLLKLQHEKEIADTNKGLKERINYLTRLLSE